MKNKILILAAILFLPLLSLAADVREEIKNQLNETIDSRSALVTALQDISGLVAEKEQGLVAAGSMDDAAKAEVDLDLKEANDALASAGDETAKELPALAEQLLASDKSSRITDLREFKKEAEKIRAEIVLARNLIIESINLIKEVE